MDNKTRRCEAREREFLIGMFKTQQEGWDREQQERPARSCRASWAIYRVYLYDELKHVMRRQDLPVPLANMLGSQSFFPSQV